MSANGIAHKATKQLKQEGRLTIAEAKKQGKTVAADGTISGPYNSTKPYWRYLNTLDINLLPSKYVGNTVQDNTAPLQAGRPWKEHLS